MSPLSKVTWLEVLFHHSLPHVEGSLHISFLFILFDFFRIDMPFVCAWQSPGYQIKYKLSSCSEFWYREIHLTVCLTGRKSSLFLIQWLYQRWWSMPFFSYDIVSLHFKNIFLRVEVTQYTLDLFNVHLYLRKSSWFLGVFSTNEYPGLYYHRSYRMFLLILIRL